ncbi:MAG: chemotaxis response regulator protein-glutamate methylesterase [Planctomycetota bacterium]|nr:chemotaxis response regulator protein-glutamate methylesterase [Planctomycetota bacterium]
MSPPVRVLIVDDSSIVRRVLTEQLSRQPDIEVVGTAPDPYIAREKILALSPDVITLDIEMPRMDGLSFLKKLMKYHPVPAIILSSIAGRGSDMAIECLEAGAVDVLSKPNGSTSVGAVAARLGDIIRGIRDVRVGCINASRSDSAIKTVSPPSTSSSPSNTRPSRSIIAIGASTGGTEALRDVLAKLPSDLPGIVIVQHMPAGFTGAFARRLNGLCQMEVREAVDGDHICSGTALIAPGDTQMKVVRNDAGWGVRVFDGPRVCRHKPSVEVLFTSVAEAAGKHATGIIMTGMGNDGARGLRTMKDAGAYTIAQDEKSCVVFGMPREAIEAGGATDIVPLDKIARRVIEKAKGSVRSAA